MTGLTRFDKSCLSTSKRKTSNSTSTYQQLEKRNLLATFVVNTSDDIVADDGLVSLREAITAANTNASFSDVAAGDETGDRIVFGPGTRLNTMFLLDGGFQITDDLVIRGYEDGDGFNTGIETNLDRIFNIDTTEQVYFRDLRLEFGRADQGALIKVNAGGNVTIKSSYLGNGFAEQGGAVYATDSRLFFDDTTFWHNNASDEGGGIWADGGDVSIVGDSRFEKSGANEGGGVFVTNGTRLFAAGTTFENNYSLEGGSAIWAANETDVFVKDSVFRSNGADPDSSGTDEAEFLEGGAIRTSGDSIRVAQSTFSGNEARRGGAVFSTATSSTFVDSVFEQNDATFTGGAGWFSTGEVRFNGGRIVDNSAEARGGGIEFATGVTQELIGIVRDIEIASNSAVAGGGISATGTDLRVVNATVADNIARTATVNAATSRGGGISVVYSDLYALDTLFENNSAEGTVGSGGAIATFGSTSFIDGSTFESNAAGTGGGIALRSGDDVTLKQTSFASNMATGGGGAVFVGGNNTLRSFNSTFDSNTSDGSGGAIYVVATGRFVSRGTSFGANVAAGEGGAILNYGTANIAGSTFNGNRATRGGAIKVGGTSGLLSIVDTTRFSSNIANANGSAISSTSSSITLINDAEFNGNVVDDGFGDLLFVGDVTFHRVTNSDVG
ncbi:CSLREA domain-containing protein [Mariniblastus fucicola]|uniref:Uncharacterized protein n=1 Tax=Mariniblastus fucicola TaxID=980251 RepID=A0A5B9P9Z8_9BACT|nr:CSLREA domain-containing protein [Mariniblastus fucicola]QEG23587.1 hypothetical protein MFFC18_34880 [Mariniblastus fucicola]